MKVELIKFTANGVKKTQIGSFTYTITHFPQSTLVFTYARLII